MRPEIDDPVTVGVNVTDFLPTSDSQTNPSEYLGININYLVQPIIGKIITGGSADKAGLKSNDKILKIGNTNIYFADDIREKVSRNPNADLEFKVLRNDEIIYVPVKIDSEINQNIRVGVLGIAFGTSRSFSQSLSKGTYETYNLSIKTLQFIGKMITGNMGTENLSGPIGIAQMAGNTAQAGFLPFMYLMALLSISLAVINLLPIPVLDGGQLSLLALEAVRGKPLPEKVENIIYTGGAALVVMLMIFAIFNDVLRFL